MPKPRLTADKGLPHWKQGEKV